MSCSYVQKKTLRVLLLTGVVVLLLGSGLAIIAGRILWGVSDVVLVPLHDIKLFKVPHETTIVILDSGGTVICPPYQHAPNEPGIISIGLYNDRLWGVYEVWGRSGPERSFFVLDNKTGKARNKLSEAGVKRALDMGTEEQLPASFSVDDVWNSPKLVGGNRRLPWNTQSRP